MVLNLLDSKACQEDVNIVFSYFVKVYNQTWESLGNYLRIMEETRSALNEIRIQGELIMLWLVSNKLGSIHEKIGELVAHNEELKWEYEDFSRNNGSVLLGLVWLTLAV